MQQNRAPFFIIIGLALVGVVAMAVVRLFLVETLELPVSLGQQSIRVAAAQPIKPWLEQAARDFNQNQGSIQVEIIAAESLIPEAQFGSAAQITPPAAWLAEATFVVQMAGSRGLAFDDARSVASSSLAWGAFNSRQEEFNQQYGELTWSAVHQAAVEPGSSLKLVIASPRNSAEGLAALISGAAAQLNSPSLSGAEAGQAQEWLSQTLRESTRNSFSLGGNPAEAFATRGVSVGDAGLLSLASWRSAGLAGRPDFSIIPARPNVTLDYPLAIWTGSQSNPESRQAAAAFRDFLLEDAQQAALADFFFEPAGPDVSNGVQADGDAALTLLRWAERELQ